MIVMELTALPIVVYIKGFTRYCSRLLWQEPADCKYSEQMKPNRRAIAITFALVFLQILPCSGEGNSIQLITTTTLRRDLIATWYTQEHGTDGTDACMIDINMQFHADGTFLYTRTFRRLDNLKPAHPLLINSGAWNLSNHTIVQHWLGNGENPSGYITKSNILHLSKCQLRCMDNGKKIVSYKRVYPKLVK